MSWRYDVIGKHEAGDPRFTPFLDSTNNVNLIIRLYTLSTTKIRIWKMCNHWWWWWEGECLCDVTWKRSVTLQSFLAFVYLVAVVMATRGKVRGKFSFLWFPSLLWRLFQTFPVEFMDIYIFSKGRGAINIFFYVIVCIYIVYKRLFLIRGWTGRYF